MPEMSDGTARFWNCIFAGVTAIGLVGGGIYTLKQYFDAREKDSKTFEFQAHVAQTEAQKQYYSKVLDLCIDVTTMASAIATSPDTPKRRRAIDDFKRYRIGPMVVVESMELNTALGEFYQCLKDTKCAVAGQPDEKNALLGLSFNIGTSCAHEIVHGFNLGRLLEAPVALKATTTP